VLLMDFSISSKRNVSAFQAMFFEMLNAWSASFFSDMIRISRGMNQRACKDCAVWRSSRISNLERCSYKRGHPRPDRGRIARDSRLIPKRLKFPRSALGFFRMTI